MARILAAEDMRLLEVPGAILPYRLDCPNCDEPVSFGLATWAVLTGIKACSHCQKPFHVVHECFGPDHEDGMCQEWLEQVSP